MVNKLIPMIFVTLTFQCQIIFSQISFPGCSDLISSDFSSHELVLRGGNEADVIDPTLMEPIQFDLDPIYQGNTITSVDAYIIQRKGKIKYFNSIDNSITEIGDFDVRTKIVNRSDYGLMGIALDPNFKTNNWIYLWYAPRTDAEGREYDDDDWKKMKLSRFSLESNKQINMNSEKVLIEILGNAHDNWHAGGPMTFDNHGDLWVTIGNNSRDHDENGANHLSTTDSVTSDEWGASNTSSMRGSIIRIHPDNSLKGYSIPQGNFAEYWANYFDSQGNSSLAAEYRNPNKALPEIYTKGHRSNFSITVHPTKGWLAWGEVNFESNLDEFNITNIPVFSGYPYFHGDQERTAGHNQNVNAPTNNSPLSSGIVKLPPSMPPTFNNILNVAITGPIYVYDSTLSSTRKFPPHFHEHWFKMSFYNRLFVSKINNEGNDVVANSNVEIGGNGNLFNQLPLANPINAKFGPDGAFYLMNYSGNRESANDRTGLYRFDYTGNCLPYKTPVKKNYMGYPKVSYMAGQLMVEDGKHQINIYNMNGKTVGIIKNSNSTRYNLKEIQNMYQFENGIYLIQVKTKSGSFKQTISLF